MTTGVYDSNFYADQKGGSAASAQHVVPDILAWLQPESVVDVGCGVGTWLAAYRDNGVSTYFGLDGPWAQSGLLIPEDRFQQCDLSQPPRLGRRFDLAQSLEVAEHLPDSAARGFVELLTGLSDYVVFSAATPRQRGTHHINEQWPSYWRALFAERGYELYDPFRARYWEDPRVEWWYAQNLFLYIKQGSPVPKQVAGSAGFVWPEKIVHPERLSPEWNVLGLKHLVKEIPPALVRSTARRLNFDQR